MQEFTDRNSQHPGDGIGDWGAWLMTAVFGDAHGVEAYPCGGGQVFDGDPGLEPQGAGPGTVVQRHCSSDLSPTQNCYSLLSADHVSLSSPTAQDHSRPNASRQGGVAT
ncbi:hypothetical protein SAM23877_6492 [Streptomyces ambofaciens ATCC 23877]|uniref:Uncharacterized protein n=1 Tax=Streptomyces ambofaciens (strain ATCC 23877 / 3486 / DSM 40053 / JCM 4204 / NBRC 12836 / NRRL B-2516) TaxID=278992 RepID=A0A0K2B386_STRA7|nr:hypothetical protein SAM23877_6492 [Streptomyces ambofaciens ATCC 23877]